MKTFKVKKIDFSSGKIEEKEIKTSSNLDLESAKSLAYVIRWQLARQRSGSAKTKTMAEISGTTAKPWKQKGTGRARQGSRRSVQFVGGRVCHGPMPRSFDFSMPKKIKKIALADALKVKIKDNKLLIFNDEKENIKTSKISNFLAKDNISNALVIYSQDNLNIQKSIRNIKNIKTVSSIAINAYDILNFDYLMVDKSTFETKIMNVL
jgi:large subunit ribosomal protein L4